MSKSNGMIRESYKDGCRVDTFGNVFFSNGSEIKTRLNRTGYCVFTFGKGRKRRRPILVHRFQAYQKYGEMVFEDEIIVRHLDGNSLNNSWDNIEIGTQSDNMMDIPRDERIMNASNPIYNHSEIISDWRNGMSYSQIMGKYGIPSKGTISFIINKSIESNKT